ncbi:MAG TPA: ACR3 family arsenite efflux transporter [Flavobacteriales bacterium]|nr:ACR3 family arsenite efflux transporter [Flavobacteriales bacterium]HIB76869.1 ACR3 family arsenite efflux transporter [Flavobacteriales bacterium]HIN40826.1 ACR3 family arsenite efflux transporter [Flavobacteriales bacterium]HIO16487.1 ACR3 family arsenite efflux transporter [Flavobacteriales bacterium]
MGRLGFLDRYLTIWIFLAMAGGIALGNWVPSLPEAIESVSFKGVNIPIAIGLILMMYPPLAKVDYGTLPHIFKDVKLLTLSMVLNWIIGPILMFALAVIFLGDRPELMTGVILIGLARCIAMVLVWNDLADGDRTYGAALVALNSLFQVFTFSFYAWFFLTIMPTWIGLEGVAVDIPFKLVAINVSLYLGIPFVLGLGGRYLLIRLKSELWYTKSFLPLISPLTLISLLFTIVVMFSLQGDRILDQTSDVLLVSIPLALYFLIMWLLSYFAGIKLGVDEPRTRAVAFTAAGNNFELAIAVAIGVFGLHSSEAFVGVIGPLIEVPALLLLVLLSKKLSKTN